MKLLINKILKKYQNLVKFLISGGTAALITFSTLYILTDIFDFWYLTSSVIAFIFGFLFNFFAQKFWAFKGDHARNSTEQLLLFFVISLINLGINSLGMYLLVDKVGLWYMLAQFLMTGMQAIVNFFIYKLFVFKETSALG